MVFLSGLLTSLPLFYIAIATTEANEQVSKYTVGRIDEGKCVFFKQRWGLDDSTEVTFKLKSTKPEKECKGMCNDYEGTAGCKGWQVYGNNCHILNRLVKEFTAPTDGKLSICGKLNKAIKHTKRFEVLEKVGCKMNSRAGKKTFDDVTRQVCDDKCGYSSTCQTYDYHSYEKTCILYDIRATKVTGIKPARVCVRVHLEPEDQQPSVTPSAKPTVKPILAPGGPTVVASDEPTPPPSDKPTAVPTAGHTKKFEAVEEYGCIYKNKAHQILENVSRATCDNKCGFSPTCMAYDYSTNSNGICITIDSRVYKFTTGKKPARVCVRVPLTEVPTDGPVKTKKPTTKKPTTKKPVRPTKKPVKPTKKPVRPTKKPVKPTNKPVEPLPKCKLQLTLGFPSNDPDKADYYGAHADWLEVNKEGDPDERTCSSYYFYQNNIPEWCSYRNTVKGSDSAYIENLEDEYYAQAYLDLWEQSSSEIIKIDESNEFTTKINAYHYLFKEDYYSSLEHWQDYKLAPVLRIHNLTTDKTVGNPSGYVHPTPTGISTHIKKNNQWVGNPKYTGNIELYVVCTKFCKCEVERYRAFGGFYKY